MKHIYIILLCALVSLGVSANNIVELADSAYSAEDYALAEQLYLKSMSSGVSSDLYYNLGNTYFRQNLKGKAILNYERALKLDPTNKEARMNLDFVNDKIVDKPGERGTFIANLVNKISANLTPDGWAWMAFAFFLITIACAAIYIFMSNVTIRKVGFFGGIVALIITLLAIFFAINAALIAKSTNKAVITKSSTILSTAPRTPKDRSEEAMLLHEGTKVEILDSITTAGDSTKIVWYDVKVDNNHRAWINANDVEII